jgi:8-oxo-dGTP diphosphatase
MLKLPRIGVAVMVIKSGRVLLGKRKGAHGAGTWALPGGHLHFGESIEACARREVMEETGLCVTDMKTGPYTNDIFTREEKHYVTLSMVARYKSGRLQTMEPDKCEKWPQPVSRPMFFQSFWAKI